MLSKESFSAALGNMILCILLSTIQIVGWNAYGTVSFGAACFAGIYNIKHTHRGVAARVPLTLWLRWRQRAQIQYLEKAKEVAEERIIKTTRQRIIRFLFLNILGVKIAFTRVIA